MLCWHFCFSDIFKHRLISLTNSPPTTSTSVVEPSSILRKVQNNIFLLFKPTPLHRRLIPRTIGRILFRHKFPQHGANLANFIVPHFPRIYSLIQGVGRGQLILTLAIVHHRWIWGRLVFRRRKLHLPRRKRCCSAQKSVGQKHLNDIDDDGHGGYCTSGVGLEHVSATLWPLSFRFNLAADIS